MAEALGHADKVRAAFTSLLAGAAGTGLKTSAWLLSGSVAALADAVHSAVDLLAVLVTYLAVRASLKPPDQEHPYGHSRAETLGALGGSLAVLASAAFVAYEAAHRLASREFYLPALPALAAMLAAMAIDVNRVMVLRRFRGVSAALEADALHFSTDLASSAAVVAVLAGGMAASAYAPQAFSAWGPVADALLGLAITGYFAGLSARLFRMAVSELLDYSPPHVAREAREAAASVRGVEAVRDVKVRKAGSVYHADVTIAVDGGMTLEKAHEIADEVERELRRRLGGNVNVHVEPFNKRRTN